VALPHHGRGRVDEREAWIERNAAELARALADPAVRADLLALLGTDNGDRQRERRLAAARRDLEGLELRWRVEDEWETST
jgi:hypothetical protein